MPLSTSRQCPLCVKLSGFAGGRANFACQRQHTAYTVHPGCVAPTGLKTTGISLYPPLTQWATVVTPQWGVFVMPRQGQQNSSPLRKRWESCCAMLSSPIGATQIPKHPNILLYNTKNSCQKPYLIRERVITNIPHSDCYIYLFRLNTHKLREKQSKRQLTSHP